jgi:uncharacterized membrane protein YdjX (TVP38/TMEM64 family)
VLVQGFKDRSIVRHVLFVAALVVLIVLIGREAGVGVLRAVAWIDGLGTIAPFAFILGYILAAVAFVPGSVLSLAGGAMFGLTRGVLYVFTGGTLGACAAFLVSRYAARRIVERRLASSARLAAVDRAIGREGLKIVFLLRLSPIVPYNVLNYGLGLTRVRFLDYAIGSIGMLPAITLYVYYGKIAGDVAALAAGAGVRRDGWQYAVTIAGLGATVLATTLIARTAKRALARAAGPDAAPWQP